MAPRELNFITGNKNKLAEVQAILSATPVKLQNQSIDLLEIQGTIEEISRDKAIRAADAVYFISITSWEEKSLMVEYTGERTGFGGRHMLVLQCFS